MVDLKVKSISYGIITYEWKRHRQISSVSIYHGVGDRCDYSYNKLKTNETILHEIGTYLNHTKERFLSQIDSIHLEYKMKDLPS